MGRAPCCDKANVKKGPWSPEEDAKLKSYIEQHGTGGNWIALPHKIGLKRCGKSCRLRWLNYLRPNIKHGGFSEHEDNIICSLYVSIGSRWSIIAAQLPGRTDNDIKNYWNTRLKKKLLVAGKQQRRKDQQAQGGVVKTESMLQSSSHDMMMQTQLVTPTYTTSPGSIQHQHYYYYDVNQQQHHPNSNHIVSFQPPQPQNHLLNIATSSVVNINSIPLITSPPPSQPLPVRVYSNDDCEKMKNKNYTSSGSGSISGDSISNMFDEGGLERLSNELLSDELVVYEYDNKTSVLVDDDANILYEMAQQHYYGMGSGVSNSATPSTDSTNWGDLDITSHSPLVSQYQAPPNNNIIPPHHHHYHSHHHSSYFGMQMQ